MSPRRARRFGDSQLHELERVLSCIGEIYDLGCDIYPLDDFVDASNTETSQHFLEWFRELECREDFASRSIHPENYRAWSLHYANWGLNAHGMVYILNLITCVCIETAWMKHISLTVCIGSDI